MPGGVYYVAWRQTECGLLVFAAAASASPAVSTSLPAPAAAGVIRVRHAPRALSGRGSVSMYVVLRKIKQMNGPVLFACTGVCVCVCVHAEARTDSQVTVFRAACRSYAACHISVLINIV